MSEEIKKLQKKVNEAREELRKLRFSNAMGQLDDLSKVKKTKKEIARLMTQINGGGTAKVKKAEPAKAEK